MSEISQRHQQDNAPLRDDEIALRAYPTKDFYFVATLMALRKPRIRIIDFQPYRYKGAREHGKDTRFWMFLCCVDESGNNYNGTHEITQLKNQFVNGDLLVEPNSLFDSLKKLRSILDDFVFDPAKHSLSRRGRSPYQTDKQ